MSRVAGIAPDNPESSVKKSVIRAMGPQVSESYSAAKTSFYTTDSIFSFHSQKGYFPSLMTDFREQFTAPFHFGKKEWIEVGAAAGITGILFTLDGKIDAWARTQKQHHLWIKEASPVITEFGNRYGYYLVGGVAAVSAMFNRPKGFETSLLATQAMITTGAWTRLIKTFTGRERPKGAYSYSHDPAGEWYGPFSQINWLLGKKPIYEFDSFPSGHTSEAFAIATVFATQYKDTEVIPILCYSTASLVGVTRLIEHEHWASDVFVGALLGYFSGRQVVSNYNRTHPGRYGKVGYPGYKKPEINLIQTGNQVGLSLKW
ncbi:MAG TPA: phosphatase PAP2 family protein [Bacteroidales bacterium]|nr:phosphatase PAP2 family protein [Bacteroidales bacterium]